ncbi:MAG: glycosyltransferase [Actinomycetota bacterium]|nr:glycosyltransferase [Actinomycetota bacterium]
MILHLVVGPDRHGVVAHSQLIATACGHPWIRAETAREVHRAQLAGAEVVHVGFTDRIFGDTIEEAVAAMSELAAEVRGAGACLSLTLHDIPYDESPLQLRRRAGYRQVMTLARGIVVSSQVELALISGSCPDAHSLRLAALPVHPRPPAGDTGSGRPPVPRGPAQVAVLGFLYPDRGYEAVIDAVPRPGRTPDAAGVLAIGQPARGHQDLPAVYAARAARRGISWQMTGYVPDDELAGTLAAAAVPVAPNRRVTASASVNTWNAHGRRVLMPDSPLGRELDRDRPGHVWLYDPDDPAALAAAVTQALADPSLTWFTGCVGDDVTIESVIGVYREHLASCRPPRPVVVGTGLVAVPGNRWDLLARRRPRGRPQVSVVIPYYQEQSRLDLVLAALGQQRYPQGRLEIVVADDGSAQPPEVSAAGSCDVRVVRQPDRGFRAAAARNLGAAAAGGDVLLFLDADTVPEPDYVRRLSRLPAVCADTVTVGRRRHAQLAGWMPDDVRGWFAGGKRPAELPEPLWLREAYQRSQHLRQVDRRSYRYLISAVLGISRSLFEELGGFDERFLGYGGEDWELAHRGYVAGAVFAHVRQAVAWHDGADWAGRPHEAGAKNAETVTLARLLPDPEARGRGQWFPYPSVLVFARQLNQHELLAVARSAFAAGVDCWVWTTPGIASELADPRIRDGDPPPDVWARASSVVSLSAAVDLAGLPQLCALADKYGTVYAGPVTVESSRARNRSRRHAPAAGPGYEPLSAYLFGRRDQPAAKTLDTASLERLLPSL